MNPSVRDRLALQARLSRDIRELRYAVHGLAEAAYAKVDVRRRVYERPLFWMTAALVVGLHLGARR